MAILRSIYGAGESRHSQVSSRREVLAALDAVDPPGGGWREDNSKLLHSLGSVLENDILL